MAPLVRDEIILWRLISELFLGLLWAGLTYSRLPSVISGLYSRLPLLAWNDPISSGPIADGFILGFSYDCTITHFLWAHGRLS